MYSFKLNISVSNRVSVGLILACCYTSFGVENREVKFGVSNDNIKFLAPLPGTRQ